jgi:putative DNA primase/helicase
MIPEAQLRKLGLVPRGRGFFVGEGNRCACPRCDKRTSDTAINLRIDPDGSFFFKCHRCNWAVSSFAHEWVRAYESADLRDHRWRSRQERQLDAERAKAEHADRVARLARARLAVSQPAPVDHPYLLDKKLPPGRLRFLPRVSIGARLIEDALLVPLQNEAGAVVTLQAIGARPWIGANGTKKWPKSFLKGGRTRHAFALVDGPVVEWGLAAPPCIAIGEGWASVASFCHIYPAYAGVAAMYADNLPAIVGIVLKTYPDACIVVAADNDSHGMAAARTAAAVEGVDILAPEGERDDWSDTWMRLGEAASSREPQEESAA